MLRTIFQKHRLLFLACFLGMALLVTVVMDRMLPMPHVQARPNVLPPVKALIITMFPLERDAWLKHGHWSVASYPSGSLHVPNTEDANSDGTVWCQTDLALENLIRVAEKEAALR